MSARGQPAGPRVARKIELRLYVAGASARSTRAIQNARAICDEFLPGRYQLEVIDVFQHPARARDDQVLAVPVLIKRRPAPAARFIGDLSDRRPVLRGLGLGSGA